jgi:hypothetical protein
MFNQEDLGIFGATGDGAPNPHVGHVHPYPTRYHGPIWTQPQAGYPYRPATYVRPSFLGYGDTITLPEQVITASTAGAGTESLFRAALVLGIAGLAFWGVSAMTKKRSR